MERLFNLDAQLLFETVLLMISIFVLFTAMSYLLFNPARKLLKDRQDKIQNLKETTEKANEDAAAIKADYDSKLKNIDKEAELILSNARKKALHSEQKIIAEAQEEASRIIERANAEIALEQKRARDDLKKQVISIASMMAGKVVTASIDMKIQDTLIDETLKEIGDDTWLS